jgi:hypothetical protein
MDLSKLRSKNPSVVQEYVEKKFKSFKGLRYPRSSRIKKVDAYYVAAAGSPHGQDVIESVYQSVFGEVYDDEDAIRRADKAAAKKPEKVKIESSAWLDKQTDYQEKVENALANLKRWKSPSVKAYEGGEEFFGELRTLVSTVDKTICDTTQFKSEFAADCRAEITSNVAITKEEVSAAFDLMVGFQQNASCTFETRSQNWGEINAKLEQSFKAGFWANGEAKARMTKAGFSAEAQAAIAIGAQFSVQGELKWTRGKGALVLSGDGEIFLGAEAHGEMKLTASALNGLELAIDAGAFAGFKANVSGAFAFEYGGNEIASVAASAGITFGAGGEFSAKLSAPIFGPSTFAIEANVAVGLGVNTDIQVAIDFNEAALAASQSFRQVVYWRTMAKGWDSSLMDLDARNLFYLNKAIARLEAELIDSTAKIKSFNDVPMEERSLLMG